MIYLYAITEPSSELPDVRGLDDAPLHSLDVERLRAVHSIHAQLQPRIEPAMLWRHEVVVEALMRGVALLPARFGTTFEDHQALEAALSTEAARLREQLERVRGCVELAVRVRIGGEQPEPRDGRDYLAGKLALGRDLRAAADVTLQPLSKLAVASRRLEGAPGQAVLAGSFLVPTGSVERFAEEVRRIQHGNGELALSCTGPWAPYSFVGGEPG